MKTLLTGIMLTILLLNATASWSEMYRWQDDKGVVTFKDYPAPASNKNKVKVYSDNDFAPSPPQKSAPALPTPTRSGTLTVAQEVPTAQPKAERFGGTVEIYITDWCGYCKKALAYMKSRNIPYVAYDIEKDASAKQRHNEFGGRGVPLIIVGTKKLTGFSPEGLERALGSK